MSGQQYFVMQKKVHRHYYKKKISFVMSESVFPTKLLQQ